MLTECQGFFEAQAVFSQRCGPKGTEAGGQKKKNKKQPPNYHMRWRDGSQSLKLIDNRNVPLWGCQTMLFDTAKAAAHGNEVYKWKQGGDCKWQHKQSSSFQCLLEAEVKQSEVVKLHSHALRQMMDSGAPRLSRNANCPLKSLKHEPDPITLDHSGPILSPPKKYIFMIYRLIPHSHRSVLIPHSFSHTHTCLQVFTSINLKFSHTQTHTVQQPVPSQVWSVKVLFIHPHLMGRCLEMGTDKPNIHRRSPGLAPHRTHNITLLTVPLAHTHWIISNSVTSVIKRKRRGKKTKSKKTCQVWNVSQQVYCNI